MPKPQRLALATGATWDTCRKLSRAKMLLMWTSITGTSTAAMASRIDTEVWVSPPGLMTMPAAFLAPASWIQSISSPSWFDLVELDPHAVGLRLLAA